METIKAVSFQRMWFVLEVHNLQINIETISPRQAAAGLLTIQRGLLHTNIKKR